MSGNVERMMLGMAEFQAACKESDCVEVATAEVVAVRDSKNAAGPVLWFSRAEWEEFVTAVKIGKFDLG
jgi:hypothetical protein